MEAEKCLRITNCELEYFHNKGGRFKNVPLIKSKKSDFNKNIK